MPMNAKEHRAGTPRAWPVAAGLALLLATTILPAAAPAQPLPAPPGEGLRFAEPDARTLALWDGPLPVLVYNHGVIRREGVPADRARSSYVHPLYGLSGEVLTDDFPRDHYHHRGLFWSWPHVEIDGRHHDLWMLQGIRHQFGRWLTREPGRDGGPARLGLENGWYVGDNRVMDERVAMVVHPVRDGARAIDLAFDWTPLGGAVRLVGAEGKSYGGLTLRYAPGTNTVITTPLGQGPDDLAMTRLPWADLTRKLDAGPDGKPITSGAAIFIAPDHPDYPPTWLTRHYGVLCLGWPGVAGGHFPAGKTFSCRYRVWIHSGAVTGDQVGAAYAAYTNAYRVASAAGPGAGTGAARPLPMRAEAGADRVRVFAGDALFTEYQFGPETKLPHFHPLNGPATGRSVTGIRLDPYPHHASLFFGLDRVNGGNYWQEGLERGRIASRGVRVAGPAEGPSVVLEQDCVWERPGAAAPFDDHRRITLAAPDARRRTVDFEITLTARTEVRILKNNHSLFAVRMAPDLSVTGGGRLVNALGDAGEAATFGKTAPWMDARGTREGGVTEGLALFSHPSNRWSPPTWFTRDYGFLSPTPMYWLPGDELRLAAGEKITLKYRVLVHADGPSSEALAAEYARWAGP